MEKRGAVLQHSLIEKIRARIVDLLSAFSLLFRVTRLPEISRGESIFLFIFSSFPFIILFLLAVPAVAQQIFNHFNWAVSSDCFSWNYRACTYQLIVLCFLIYGYN